MQNKEVFVMSTKALAKIYAIVIAVIIIVAVIAVAVYLMFQPAPAAREEIHLGSYQSLTGTMAMYGIEHVFDIETAVEDINNAGGVYVEEYGKRLNVTVTILDDKSDPAGAADAVERLVKIYNVDFILGGESAVLNIPGMIAAEKMKTPLLSSYCFVEPFLEQNLTWCVVFFFDIKDSIAVKLKVLNDVLPEGYPREVGLVFEDTFDGQALNGLWQELADDHGFTIKTLEWITPGALDYSTTVNKLKAANVEHVIFFSTTYDLVVFIKNCKELNYNWKYMNAYKASWPTQTWDILGKDAQYIMSDVMFYGTYPYEGAESLWNRFKERFGRITVCGIGTYYSLAQMLFQAIEEAGTLKKDVVLKTLINGGPWKTVMGDYKFDPRGFAIFPYGTAQWVNGTLELVYPYDWATTDLLYPAPPWSER